MNGREMIKEELAQLLETCYNGSFDELVCDYIRHTGMTPQEVEQMLEEIRKAKGA
jgi:predicted transcriptional regulator